MTYTFDSFFNGIDRAERMRIFEDAQLEADLDALQRQFRVLAQRMPKDVALGVAVNAATRALRETGAVDWRFVVAALVGESDHAVTCDVIERMARKSAEPGAAAAAEKPD